MMRAIIEGKGINVRCSNCKFFGFVNVGERCPHCGEDTLEETK